MTQITVVSSWSPKGAALYGNRFIEHARRYWHPSFRFLFYLEDLSEVPLLTSNMTVVPFLELTSWRLFEERYKDDPKFSGFPEPGGEYNYRWDAMKFSRKVFAMADAARPEWGTQDLLWLDGDTIVRRGKTISPDWFLGMLGDAECAYLGRDRTHSETGFLYFRGPALSLPHRMASEYLSGAFKDYERCITDSEVFDRVRQRSFLKFADLTRGKRAGAVFERSVLGERLEHLKGKRKELAA